MDPILITCFFLSNGDVNNQLILTHDKLIIIYKGKSQAYYRSNILKFELNRKKLIIPLIIGGIGTSMAMIAMSMGWYHRQLNLIVMFCFFGIMYYGFTGKDALELFEKGHSNIFLLNKASQSISGFLRFFSSSQAFQNYTSQNFIYHLADPKEWESQLGNQDYKVESLVKEGFIHASIASQVETTYNRYYGHKDSMVLLTIVPEFLSAELKYEFSEDRDESFPHIFGAINKASIARLQYYSADSNINFRLE